MEPGGQTDRGPRHYVRALARRKSVVLLAIVLVPATTLVQSLRQERVYEASARVIPSSRPISPELRGAYSPAIAAKVLAKIPVPGETARDLLSATIVSTDTGADSTDASATSADTSADVITFSVRQHEPGLARQLANEYAHEYTLYRQALDEKQLKPAITVVRRQIASAREGNGAASSPLLATRRVQLRTLEALRTASAPVVDPATSASQVAPRLVRNLLLAVALGTLLGLGLAWLWEALDGRFASAAEVARAVGMPLLARVRPPPRGSSGDPLAARESTEAETFRMLRGNVEFFLGKLSARTIMVAGARRDEGSTSVAVNLAVALARAGRRITLVDLDPRRSGLTRMLGLEGHPGVTDVVRGSIALDDAIATLGLGEGYGVMRVVPAGAPFRDPGEFLATPALGSVLDALRTGSEVLVVDAPPLLEGGDAVAVSDRVEAVLLVMRADTSRRTTIDALRRVLAGYRADALGFVLVGGRIPGEQSLGWRSRGVRAAPVAR
jgi:Mrp family chromosome partitioning ATPase